MFFLTLLSLSLVSYSSVPTFIEKNTLNNICKYSECSSDLKEQYKKSYYKKQFYKAFIAKANASAVAWSAKSILAWRFL